MLFYTRCSLGQLALLLFLSSLIVLLFASAPSDPNHKIDVGAKRHIQLSSQHAEIKQRDTIPPGEAENSRINPNSLKNDKSSLTELHDKRKLDVHDSTQPSQTTNAEVRNLNVEITATKHVNPSTQDHGTKPSNQQPPNLPFKEQTTHTPVQDVTSSEKHNEIKPRDKNDDGVKQGASYIAESLEVKPGEFSKSKQNPEIPDPLTQKLSHDTSHDLQKKEQAEGFVGDSEQSKQNGSSTDNSESETTQVQQSNELEEEKPAAAELSDEGSYINETPQQVVPPTDSVDIEVPPTDTPEQLASTADSADQVSIPIAAVNENINPDINIPTQGTDPTVGQEASLADATLPLDAAIIDAVALAEKHDILAFADWKKELENATKTNGGSQKVIEPESTEKRKKKLSEVDDSSKTLRNYASHECGAKVISSNKEAKNLQAALNENKDEYVMQPCSANKKYLNIELCEPVLIRKIDIANLELFSSTFENFTVYVSTNNGGKERNGKEWQPIGTFRAKDERSVQSFSISQLDLYTSLVKIEILSHYGNEHFCPITIVRVYGYSVDEDDDDNETSNTQEDSQTTEAPSIKQEEEIAAFIERSFEATFPPQPRECYRCYLQAADLPTVCVLPIYELSELPTEPTSSPDRSIQSGAQDQINDSSESIQPTKVVESSPSESSTTQTTEEPEQTSGPSASHSDSPASASNGNKTNKVRPTSQSTHTAGDAGGKTVPISATSTTKTPKPSHAPASASEVRVTASQPAETADGIEPSDEDLILPSPIPIPPTQPTNGVHPSASVESPAAEQPSNQQEQEPQQAMNQAQEKTESHQEQEKTANQAPPEDVDSFDDEESGITDPPPAARGGKRYTAISRLNNQVKSLEQSLQLTNRYLEEMSKKYKDQKEDLQKALNVTMRALQNATKKLSNLEKEYNVLKETTNNLQQHIEALQQHIEDSEAVGYTIPIIIATLVAAVVISSLRRPSGMSQQEIEKLLENMPAAPVIKGHKRSGSDQGTVGHGVKPAITPRLKKCSSYAAVQLLANDTPTDGAKRRGENSSDTRAFHNQHVIDESFVSKLDDESTDSIEVISQTHWRTFDTPVQNVLSVPQIEITPVDAKSGKHKKKRRQKHGASGHILTNQQLILDHIRNQDFPDDSSSQQSNSSTHSQPRVNGHLSTPPNSHSKPSKSGLCKSRKANMNGALSADSITNSSEKQEKTGISSFSKFYSMFR